MNPTPIDLSTFAPRAQQFGTIGGLVSTIGRVAALVGAGAVVFTLVYAAYLYLNAQGEAKNVEQARMALTWSIIGMVIIAVAYWVTQIIARLLGKTF